MTKEEITTKCLERLKKCEELLQKNQSWGAYVSCALATEIVKQAVEDACFFMQKHKVKLIDEEKRAKQDIKGILLNMAINGSYVIKDEKNPIDYSMNVFAYYLGKQNNKKFRVHDLGYGYKIVRIK
jgi:hypothetical protein